MSERPTHTRTFWSAGATVLLTGVVLMTGGSKPGRVITASRSEPAVAVDGKLGTMEHLGLWVNAAGQTFSRVKDYQCTFTKRERIDNRLQDEQTAQMKVRNEPFSVYLKFTAPRSISGKEASYVDGRHNGRMKAKSGGALGLVGYVTIDPRDPRAMKDTRHSITEAGVGNLIKRLKEAQAQAVKPGAVVPRVLVGEGAVAGRVCVRFDITDAAADGEANQFRTVVYFDKDTNLPVRYESYNRAGVMVESFAYSDLRFNVGLTDASFP